jgi:ParB family chromosome partitioning protein
MMADKKRVSGLGRGLSALLEEAASPPPPPGAESAAGAARLPIADVIANPDQPRRRFTPEAMADLTASITEHGVLQPILVRPLSDGRYEIVAGERRWRAAQAAGLHEIPAIIRPLEAAQAFEIALIENIQRADLNAVEEARGYRRLMDEFGHTQQALATIIGKSRSHIANLLRLLDLPETVLALVEGGQLSMGHARAMVGLPEIHAEYAAVRAVKEGLSVRAVERLAKSPLPPELGGPLRPAPVSATAAVPADANSESLEFQLAEVIGMPVALQVAPGGTSGSLSIRFADLDQLDWLVARLGGGAGI